MEKHKEIGIGAPDTAGFVHLERIMGRSSFLIGDLSGKNNISGREEAGIHIIVNGLFREHDLIRGVGTYRMDGLPLPDQGREKSVKLQSFVFGDTDTGMGFGADSLILHLSGLGGVDMLFKSAVFPFGKAIADIRGPG
ncbi:hypothetical protein AALA90_18010 [Lachnospiraceae bacterium 38-10]